MPLDEGQPGTAEPDISTGGTTFEMPPDPPPGDADDVAEPAQGAARPGRAERRAERGRDYAAAARAATDEARAAKDRAQALEVQLAELRGRVTAGEARQQQGAPDPEVAKMAAVRKRISSAVARMGAGDASAEDDWHAAQEEHARIVARQVAREEGAEVERRVTGRIPAPVDPGQAALMGEFPFMANGRDDKPINPAARAIANGYIAQLVALEKRDMENPDVRMATLREAATHAAKVLGLGGSARRPTDADRGRVSGTGGRDSGAGNPSGGRVHLNDAQKSQALALARHNHTFAGLNEDQIYQKWWKEIGVNIENK